MSEHRYVEHKLDQLHRDLISENNDLRTRLNYFLTDRRLSERIREHLDSAEAAAEAAGGDQWMLDPQERTLVADMLGRALYKDLVLALPATEPAPPELSEETLYSIVTRFGAASHKAGQESVRQSVYQARAEELLREATTEVRAAIRRVVEGGPE